MSQAGHDDGRMPRDDMVLHGLRQLAIDPQEDVPADFHARVMAQAEALPVPRPRWWAWPRIGAPAWAVPALATCLALLVSFNVWLGVQLIGDDSVYRMPSSGAPQEQYGRVQLAFADNAREQDLRTLLLSLRATILAGPSPQGVYLVQVPLAGLVPRLRGSPGTPTAPDPMHLLLEELRAHPAVRLAEPVTSSE